ncbi:hypothetical protein J3D55_001697 [Chryseobacterium ginsenosidimutans]|uniref:hypothetical protein n=1 Tax=Chryseobacterium ginsenosidimutans TaxID=687846 RepID=UPI0021671737|nr:hypothetical protein [Chryseobacterium ginsenosidimutans]MCS3868781.1 hypothetical protein [Chryseobacterium ginsenosidimutans]
MSSTSEVGHAKNVANLQKLVQQISVYTLYNPPVPELAVANLQTLYNTATAKLTEVEDKRNANKNAIALRQTAFENLKATCTRIINRLEILGLLQGTLDQAKSLNRTIQGGKKKPAATPEEGKETPKTVSTSRQSFTQQTDNFGILIQLLTTVSAYAPDEDELKLANLNTYKDSLVSATQTVDQTEAELNIKLMERDKILYTEGTGLYTIAQNAKKYVKSLYGATSPEYTTVSAIGFTTRK